MLIVYLLCLCFGVLPPFSKQEIILFFEIYYFYHKILCAQRNKAALGGASVLPSSKPQTGVVGKKWKTPYHVRYFFATLVIIHKVQKMYTDFTIFQIT